MDTSQSQRSVLDEEREASSSFLDGMLAAPPDRAPDRAFLIQFAREVELLQDLTSSRPKLQAAIKRSARRTRMSARAMMTTITTATTIRMETPAATIAEERRSTTPSI